MDKIDKLCKQVNEKYNLQPNSIGSVEHHSDMCENSIVQIVTKSRGTRQLIYGENKTLEQYLKNILEDRVELNFLNIK